MDERYPQDLYDNLHDDRDEHLWNDLRPALVAENEMQLEAAQLRDRTGRPLEECLAEVQRLRGARGSASGVHSSRLWVRDHDHIAQQGISRSGDTLDSTRAVAGSGQNSDRGYINARGRCGGRRGGGLVEAMRSREDQGMTGDTRLDMLEETRGQTSGGSKS